MSKFDKLVESLPNTSLDDPIRCIKEVKSSWQRPTRNGYTMDYLPAVQVGEVTTIRKFCTRHSVWECQVILGDSFVAV